MKHEAKYLRGGQGTSAARGAKKAFHDDWGRRSVWLLMELLTDAWSHRPAGKPFVPRDVPEAAEYRREFNRAGVWIRSLIDASQ